MRGFKSPDNYLNVKKSKGFSLIEMLVAMLIFSIIASAAIGFFVFAVRSQIKVLASQKVANEASYVMEYMSRYLRMAKKELNCTDPNDLDTCSRSTNSPNCLSATDTGFGYNYEIPELSRNGSDPSLGSAIKFINYKGECQEFYVQGGVLWETTWIGGTSTSLPITSNNVEITSLQFKLSGQSQEDNLQPRVTLSLSVRKKPELKPEINIQTTISQRDIDTMIVAP